MSVEELIEAAKKERGQQRYSEALSSARAAVDRAPDDADAWWQVALAHYSLNDLTSASTALRRTLDLAPSFAYGWTLYGRTLWRLKENDQAQKALERALELDSNEDAALEILADLYWEKNDDENQFSVLNRLAMAKGVPPRFYNQFCSAKISGFSSI
jgi:tetratricopeptide (TPR) repeat protein